jgi:hypothetical protein
MASLDRCVLRDRPLLSTVFSARDDFVPRAGSAYVFATSSEDRSAHSPDWERNAAGVNFVRVSTQTSGSFRATVGSEDVPVSLRSGRELQEFWRRLGVGLAYLDITGLGHNIWAPLLKAAVAVSQPLVVVYVEPKHYRFSAAPTEGEIFDLSERILGIDPIPGFVALSDDPEEDVCFIPLLGFEGTRLAFILENVQPPGGKVVPVVGVPGFKMEYPFYTYHGNRSALTDTRSWRNVRYAAANCPFSVFHLLEEVAAEHAQDVLKIAPIGTKPHALGAVLYTITSRRRVELVYDHPVRKAQRTEGTDRLLTYDVTTFLAGR